MNKIDLKAILAKHNLYPDSATNIFCRDGKGGSQLDRQLSAMQELWNTAVGECMKSATCSDEGGVNSHGDWSEHWIVDKHSIEQVKKMIIT